MCVCVCVGGGVGGGSNTRVFSDVGVLGEGDLDLVTDACAQSLIVHPQHNLPPCHSGLRSQPG